MTERFAHETAYEFVPVLSLVTINLNNASGLKRTLESVERQECSELFEHIIIDGESTDDSVSVIQEYANRKPEVFFQIEKDNGVYHAMNKGLSRCKGIYVAFLNSGDELAHSSVLKEIVEAVTINKNISLTFGDILIVKEGALFNRKWVCKSVSIINLMLGMMPPHPMCTIHRQILNEMGGFDTRLKIAADYDLMLRILTRPGMECVRIPQVLVNMEAGGLSNGSLRNIIKGNFEVLLAWSRASSPFIPFWIILTKPVLKLFQFLQYLLHRSRKMLLYEKYPLDFLDCFKGTKK